MSVVQPRVVDEEPPPRRVREEVKDGVAVIAASAGLSTLVALTATLVMKLAG